MPERIRGWTAPLLGGLFAVLVLLAIVHPAVSQFSPSSLPATGTGTGTGRVEVAAGVQLRDDDRLKVLATTRFDVRRAGSRYRVRTRLGAKLAPSATASIVLLVGGVSCRREGGDDRPDALSQSRNVLPGTVAALKPRLVMVAERAGRYRCDLRAYQRRVRPEDSGRADLLSAGTSHLTISGPIAGGARQGGGERSFRLAAGQRRRFAKTGVSLAGSRRLQVSGDVHLTACTAVGGSSDRTTRGANLCAGRKNLAGSLVSTELVVRQLRRSGRSACYRRTFKADPPSRRIYPNLHHEAVYMSGRFTGRRRSSRCGSRVEISLLVSAMGGSDVVVHGPGSVTVGIPGR